MTRSVKAYTLVIISLISVTFSVIKFCAEINQTFLPFSTYLGLRVLLLQNMVSQLSLPLKTWRARHVVFKYTKLKQKSGLFSSHTTFMSSFAKIDQFVQYLKDASAW